MKDKIVKILSDIRPEFNFLDSTDFVEDGMLDSFDVITLVNELDREFGISIDGMDVLPENFSSITKISELLKRNGAAE